MIFLIKFTVHVNHNGKANFITEFNAHMSCPFFKRIYLTRNLKHCTMVGRGVTVPFPREKTHI